MSVESEALERHEELAPPASLFGAEQLSAEEAARLLADEHSRLVVLVGDRGSGKTSLCVELYERQRSQPSGVRFAGSWTLLALEQLAHMRRAGGGSPPPTPEAGDHHILHLALQAGETPRHLLLGDLSGEVFRRLAHNQLSAADVPLLARADKLVLLVDGEQLVDAGARSSALTWVRQLVERLRSQRLPKPGAQLALAVTKWEVAGADRGAVAYWGPREGELLAELRALADDPRALHLGASGNPAGDGLAALTAWMLEVDVEGAAPEPPADLLREPIGLAQPPVYDALPPPVPLMPMMPPPRRRSMLPWRRRR